MDMAIYENLKRRLRIKQLLTQAAVERANSTSLAENVQLSGRQRRAFNALWRSPGWVTREEMDRIAGSSNSPAVIATLRYQKGLGPDGIETEHFNVLDRDGNPCRPGRYRLTELGRVRAEKLGLVEAAG